MLKIPWSWFLLVTIVAAAARVIAAPTENPRDDFETTATTLTTFTQIHNVEETTTLTTDDVLDVSTKMTALLLANEIGVESQPKITTNQDDKIIQTTTEQVEYVNSPTSTDIPPHNGEIRILEENAIETTSTRVEELSGTAIEHSTEKSKTSTNSATTANVTERLVVPIIATTEETHPTSYRYIESAEESETTVASEAPVREIHLDFSQVPINVVTTTFVAQEVNETSDAAAESTATTEEDKMSTTQQTDTIATLSPVEVPENKAFISGLMHTGINLPATTTEEPEAKETSPYFPQTEIPLALPHETRENLITDSEILTNAQFSTDPIPMTTTTKAPERTSSTTITDTAITTTFSTKAPETEPSTTTTTETPSTKASTTTSTTTTTEAPITTTPPEITATSVAVTETITTSIAIPNNGEIMILEEKLIATTSTRVSTSSGATNENATKQSSETENSATAPTGSTEHTILTTAATPKSEVISSIMRLFPETTTTTDRTSNPEITTTLTLLTGVIVTKQTPTTKETGIEAETITPPTGVPLSPIIEPEINAKIVDANNYAQPTVSPSTLHSTTSSISTPPADSPLEPINEFENNTKVVDFNHYSESTASPSTLPPRISSLSPPLAATPLETINEFENNAKIVDFNHYSQSTTSPSTLPPTTASISTPPADSPLEPINESENNTKVVDFNHYSESTASPSTLPPRISSLSPPSAATPLKTINEFENNAKIVDFNHYSQSTTSPPTLPTTTTSIAPPSDDTPLEPYVAPEISTERVNLTKNLPPATSTLPPTTPEPSPSTTPDEFDDIKTAIMPEFTNEPYQILHARSEEARSLSIPARIHRLLNDDGVEVLSGYSIVELSN